MQGFSRNSMYKSSHLMASMKRPDSGGSGNSSSETKLQVRSSPKTWPGVSQLTKLLEREQDIEAPKLKVLLFESLLAVYSSLFLNAFVFYDCATLCRLMDKKWDCQMWNSLFGGGGVTEYRYKAQLSATRLGERIYSTSFTRILHFVLTLRNDS
jgi:uncharacterized protein (DUF486 family)